jgi:hypothetical protein
VSIAAANRSSAVLPLTGAVADAGDQRVYLVNIAIGADEYLFVGRGLANIFPYGPSLRFLVALGDERGNASQLKPYPAIAVECLVKAGGQPGRSIVGFFQSYEFGADRHELHDGSAQPRLNRRQAVGQELSVLPQATPTTRAPDKISMIRPPAARPKVLSRSRMLSGLPPEGPLRKCSISEISHPSCARVSPAPTIAPASRERAESGPFARRERDARRTGVP